MKADSERYRSMPSFLLEAYTLHRWQLFIIFYNIKLGSGMGEMRTGAGVLVFLPKPQVMGL